MSQLKQSKRFKAPGAGFVLVVSAYALLAGFMSWSLGHPDLDKVQTLYLELRTGRRELVQADLKLFGRGMQAYPNLLMALGGEHSIISPNRDGWLVKPNALLLRTGTRTRSLQLQAKTFQTVSLKAWDGQRWRWQDALTLSPGQSGTLTLPPAPPQGELIALEAESSVRVSFVSAVKGEAQP